MSLLFYTFVGGIMPFKIRKKEKKKRVKGRSRLVQAQGGEFCSPACFQCPALYLQDGGCGFHQGPRRCWVSLKTPSGAQRASGALQHSVSSCPWQTHLQNTSFYFCPVPVLAAVRRITCVVPLYAITLRSLPSPCHDTLSCSDPARSMGKVLGGSSWTSAEQDLPARAADKCRGDRRS